MIKTSICISTHNKTVLLENTLDSIYVQKPSFEFETIVVDDGSKDEQVKNICAKFPVRYWRIDRPPIFLNPCIARNVAYRMALGDVIIAQSDEVLHITPDVIERLTLDLSPEHFLLANVLCLDWDGSVCGYFVGPKRQKPYFFLGSLYRKDLYSIGGNDEDFRVAPAYEDDWFGECLINGAKLTPIYSTNIVGHHQRHEYSTKPESEGLSRKLFEQKHHDATAGKIPWCSSEGPWQ